MVSSEVKALVTIRCVGKKCNLTMRSSVLLCPHFLIKSKFECCNFTKFAQTISKNVIKDYVGM